MSYLSIFCEFLMRALPKIFAGKLQKENVDLGPVRVCFRYARFYPGFYMDWLTTRIAFI